MITLETLEGPKKLRIAALTNDYLGGGLVLYMQRDVAESSSTSKGEDAYGINADPDKLPEVRAN